MNLVLVADAFPPMKTSGAVQMRDLVSELASKGHQLTVLLPDSTIEGNWEREEYSYNVTLLRLRALPTKDIHYLWRAIGEQLLSFFMYQNLKRSPFRDATWDALIWYSPTIFFGSLVHRIKKKSACPAYLILRDIFPEWAVDTGLLSRGFIYKYFKKVERYQYEQADFIGVQTSSNIRYFAEEQKGLNGEIEVLNNWLSNPHPRLCSIQLSDSSLAGRRIFIYTGNIGIAQGMDILIDLADVMKTDKSVGFVFVGRGTAVAHIKERAAGMGLSNILFFDEIDPNEIPSLLQQCHAGLIALDPRHRNDNIPGKFLAYMQSGLPVLGNINAGNDLVALVEEHRVGKVISTNSLYDLQAAASDLLVQLESDDGMRARCLDLANLQFSARSAARQVVDALKRV